MKNKLLKMAGLVLIATLPFNYVNAAEADKTPAAAQKTAQAKKKSASSTSIAEKNCLALVGLRLGDTYRKKVTDRHEGKNKDGNVTYSFVGTAESLDDNLSFVCKLEFVNEKYNITEFSLMRVVPQDSVNFDENSDNPPTTNSGMMKPLQDGGASQK